MRLTKFFKITLGFLTLSSSLVALPSSAQLEQDEQFRLNAPQLSCAGIGEPLSKVQIEDRRPAGADKVTTALFEQFVINQTTGDANPGTSLRKNVFEQGGVRFPSEFRKQKTKNRAKKKSEVEPDLVGSVTKLVIRDGAVTELIEYQQSLFVDAKLVGNNIA